MLIFTILAHFVYFPCISDRNLLILLILLQNYPAHKIDHFPHLRILLLYRYLLCCDPGSTVRTSALYYNSPIERTTPIEHALVFTIVCCAYDLHRHSSISNAWRHTPIYGSPFNFYSFDL